MDRTVADPLPARPPSVNWRGRSGTFYALAAGSLDTFVLSGTELYLLARGNSVLWVGSENELVADSANRDRFRRALADADGVYFLQSPADEAARLTLAWDLEGAERMGGLSLA